MSKARVFGWLWIVGLVAAAAVVITTRLHAWETVLEPVFTVLGILVVFVVFGVVTILAIEAILIGGVDG